MSPKKFKIAGTPDTTKPTRLDRWQQIADITLKFLSCIAIPATGIWAYYQFDLKGADDWVNNMTITTDVLPYQEKLRLLVVHIKSRNPTSATLNLNQGHASFDLIVRKIPVGLKEGASFDETQGEPLAKINLLEEDIEMLPNAEFDEMRAIIVPAGAALSVSVLMENENGTKTSTGKPDHDFVTAATVVLVSDEDVH